MQTLGVTWTKNREQIKSGQPNQDQAPKREGGVGQDQEWAEKEQELNQQEE